jgi:hypothetical protein
VNIRASTPATPMNTDRASGASGVGQVQISSGDSRDLDSRACPATTRPNVSMSGLDSRWGGASISETSPSAGSSSVIRSRPSSSIAHWPKPSRIGALRALSHVVAMLYAQLTHAIGLNDVCDGLRHHAGWLARIRGASPPSRNGFSHANKIRDAGMAEKLFWGVLQHLRAVQPRFGTGRGRKGLAHRFKRVIHVVDSTTIRLSSFRAYMWQMKIQG